MKKYTSVQYKLMISLIVLTIVLLLSISWIFIRSVDSIVLTSNEKVMNTLSQETANKIDRFMFERYGDVQVMAKSPLLTDIGVDKNTKIQYLQNVINAYKTYDYIYIVNNKGDIEGNVGEKSDKTYKKWIDQVLKGNTYVSDFQILSNKNSIKNVGVVYFAAPITSNKGEINGAVVVRMNMNAINDIVHNVSIGKTGFAYISDLNGIIIHDDSSTNKKVSLINENFDGNTKIFYNKINMDTYIASVYKIKSYNTNNKNWYLIVQVPMKEVFQITSAIKKYLIIIVLVSSVLLYAFALFISQRITSPLKTLVNNMQQLVGMDGNSEVTNNKDEIGTLSQSFNALQLKLQSMVEKVLELSGEAASMEGINEYIDKIYDEVPGAIITMDNNYKITSINNTACNTIGINKNEILGKQIDSPVINGIISIKRMLKEGINNETTYLKKLVNIRDLNGNIIPLIISTYLQKHINGELLGVIVVFRKVEEIEDLKESITRANNLRELGEIAAGMAHEIRNPLTSIKGYAQYIKGELNSENDLVHDIDIIIKEVDRLNNIIVKFLTYARPKKPVFNKKNLNNVIKEVIAIEEKEIEDRNINLSVTYEELPDIFIDHDLVVQAILNILINAVQVTKENGNIKIKTIFNNKKKLIKIIIEDEGPGIDSVNYDKIFTPFFTTKQHGTGLGLAICQNIIQSHNGYIELNSTLKRGTQFIISFPA